MAPSPTTVAVVDLGSNSTRLLVAEVAADGSLRELERESTVTRLGQGVDATGRLADEAVARVLDVVARYRELIDRHGAGQVVAVATSAVRDSANGEELRAALRDRFGIDARTISGDEEARLTFLGATSSRAAGEETLVVDIGGGSTELVVGRRGEEPGFHVSTQVGSVRHSERHLHDDPPGGEQLAALREDVRGAIAAAVPDEVRRGVRAGIAVAGTATQLGAVDLALEPYDPDRVHGHTLTAAAIERILERLAAVPLAEREGVTGLDPARAPTIVAGAAILAEVVRAFALDSIEVSVRDILHGAASAAASNPVG